MKQCILFARVSTQVQELESQIQEIKAEASRLGYNESQQILIKYKESAIKLSADERKGIQELKDNIENNDNIECIIVYEISRLSRRITMLFEIRDYLIERNIQLVCCKPYLRLLENGKLSQTASLVFSMMSSLSESEMIIKKERLMRGRMYKRDSGRFIGGNILYGYKVGKDDIIEIDYEDAEIVRKIFNWYNEGRSFRWIAYELLQRGIGPWTGINSVLCSIKRLARRIEYTGTKGNTYKYPRIISDELFNSVQAKITKSKSKFINSGKYLGQGIIRDDKFHYSMSCDGKRYYLNRDDVDRSDKIAINKDAVDKWLWELCEPRAKAISREKSIKVFQHDTQVLNSKIHTVQMNIEHLKATIDKINERIVKGKLDEAKGDEMIEETEHEIERMNILHNEYTNKLISLKVDEVDLSNKQAVVRNEIEMIYVKRLPQEGKYHMKELEVHFRDGDIKKYKYRSWSRFCKIEDAEL